MNDDEEAAVEGEDQALPEAPESHDRAALHLGHRRIDGAQDEGARQTKPQEPLADHARLEGRQIRDDVR